MAQRAFPRDPTAEQSLEGSKAELWTAMGWETPGDECVKTLPGRSGEVCEDWMRRVRGGPVDKAAHPWCPQQDKDPVIPTCQSGCEG